MANQFTVAEAEGKPKPKSTNAYVKGTRVKMDPKQKDAIRAEFAASKMERFIKDEAQLTTDQVSACKTLMLFGKATLQSIQQTVEEKPADESEIVASLAHILAANPALLKPIIEADPGVRSALQSILIGGPVEVEMRSEPATNAAQQSA